MVCLARFGYAIGRSGRGAAAGGCQGPRSQEAETSKRSSVAEQITEARSGLAAPWGICLNQLDAVEVLDGASSWVATLASCRVEASYRNVDGAMVLCPPSQPQRPEIDRLLRESGGDGQVEVPDRGWGWAFALRYQHAVYGCLIVSAAAQPNRDNILVLTSLAQQTGAALACAELHRRDAVLVEQLQEANANLATAAEGLQRRTNVHEVLGAAAAAGEQGICDALYELTALSIVVEDRFGNLRCWAGPARPQRYPKPNPDSRGLMLHELGIHVGATRVGDRVAMLVQSRAEILGVVALIDPDGRATDNDLFALGYASTVLGQEFSHQRNLAEMELNLRRELVADLVAGTDEDGAYLRAEALGHDLRRAHYVVVVVQSVDGAAGAALAVAAGGAASAMRLNCLQGRHAGMVVLVTDGRPDAGALHRAISRRLGRPTIAIGIGSRCDVPGDFPCSFAKARRALNVRLHSAAPAGASAYDELGFYHLVDAAHSAGAVEDFVREWLGVLIDYDNNKNSDLVLTLSDYLECGGNYDHAAADLHIHRSTLRYRLARIGQLSGYDLRDVDTRFNLHAATRAWRFLTP